MSNQKPQRMKKKNSGKTIFTEIMIETLPELIKNMNPEIKTTHLPSRINKEKNLCLDV